MHRILMRTVVIDFPPDVHDAARDFWAVALAAEARPGHVYPEYHVLEHSAATGPVMVQRLKDGASRIHLDIETDDPESEVSRLIGAGATVVERHKDWTVMRDPGGLVFCVVPPGSEDFADIAHPVD
jgi:hypothetical protein